MNRVKKAIVTVGILALWAASMWWLIRYQAFPEYFALRPSTGYQAIFEEGMYFMDSWMQIYFKDDPIGYSRTWVDSDPENPTEAYTVNNHTILDIKVMGEIQKVRVRATAALDGDYRLQSFDFTMRSHLYKTKINGRRRADGKYLVTIDTLGITSETVIDIPDDVVIYSPMTEIALSKLKPGQTLKIRTLDPVSLTVLDCLVEALRTEEIQYLDTITRTTVVKVKAQGMESTAWIDNNGRTLRQQTPFGWRMEATTASRIKVATSSEMTDDLLRGMAVPCRGVIDNPAECSRLEIELCGPGIENLAVDSNRQTVQATNTDCVTITSLRPGLPESGVAFNEIPVAMAPYLRPTLYIQSNDRNIKATARSIAGDAADTLAAAESIYKWVYRNVRKGPAMSVPSAAAVLKTLKGDCNEHTYLFVALARAAGVPAEIHVGIVYKDGDFYYHAWPAAYVGEWIEMDPTWGQPCADATHITLARGELENQIRLIGVIGQLEATVISQDDTSR